MSVVMRLLAPPAMTNDRIAQTEGTPTKDRFPTSRPVEARFAMILRKWDNGNRTDLERLYCWAESCEDLPLRRAFPLPLSYRRITLVAFGQGGLAGKLSVSREDQECSDSAKSGCELCALGELMPRTGGKRPEQPIS